MTPLVQIYHSIGGGELNTLQNSTVQKIRETHSLNSHKIQIDVEKMISRLQFECYPGHMLLNFSDQMGSGKWVGIFKLPWESSKLFPLLVVVTFGDT